MKTAAIFLLWLALPASAQRDAASEQLKGYYDKAFEYYVAKDYTRAIEQWELALKTDPKQVTARNMIDDARRKLSQSAGSQRSKFTQLMAAGRYQEAQFKLEEMLALDPGNPEFTSLQARLKRVTAVAGAKPSNSKPWNVAAAGLAAFVGFSPDPAFAYDALRYARELAPKEARFEKLVALVEEEEPNVKLNDSKPENVSVIEHKKEVALHEIYDGKYYLAVKELEAVIRLEPGDVVSLKRLGSAYLQLKNYPQARHAWQKALAISPEDEQLKEYLAALDKASPQTEAPPSPRRKARQKRAAAQNE